MQSLYGPNGVLYNSTQSYHENAIRLAESGELQFPLDEIPSIDSEKITTVDFCGNEVLAIKIGDKKVIIGTPALLEWQAAPLDLVGRILKKQGGSFNSMTTIRTGDWKGNKTPNVGCTKSKLGQVKEDEVIIDSLTDSTDIKSYSNNCGVPSHAPDEYVPEGKKAITDAKANKQICVPEIMGTFWGSTDDVAGYIEDWKKALRLVAKMGSNVCVLNYSNPHRKDKKEGTQFRLSNCAQELTAALAPLAQELGIQMFVKLGYVHQPVSIEVDAEILKNVLLAIAPNVAGVITNNTIPRKSINTDGGLYYGSESRAFSGVSGPAIAEPSFQQTKTIMQLKQEHEALKNMIVIHTGGIHNVETFKRVLDLGVDGILSGTAFVQRPSIFAEIINSL